MITNGYSSKSDQYGLKIPVLYTVGFPMGWDSATFWDKGTKVSSKSWDKGTTR